VNSILFGKSPTSIVTHEAKEGCASQFAENIPGSYQGIRFSGAVSASE
jgi:hypothetical protein